MASSVNKVILVGNLGNDPEQRTTGNGRAVTSFRIATNERWTDQTGQPQEKVNWHNVVVWGKLAETCARYLSKGRRIYVEGKLENRSYEDKDGNTRYVTDIVARDVVFLDSRGGEGGGGDFGGSNYQSPPPARQNNRQQPSGNADNWAPPPPDYDHDDDIPF
ncbi:MAG: single-stranded DNA-binding protein [Myxococcales bacterium]|nr:single-stranded DNA-binding protein [Myxococcales bacterium]